MTTSTGANNVASTSKTPMNFFEGAAISGGHISVSINTPYYFSYYSKRKLYHSKRKEVEKNSN